MCNSIDDDLKHAELMLENKQLKQLLINENENLQEHKKHNNEIEHEKEHKALGATIRFLTEKVAMIEKERREEKIASILQGAYADEEFKEQVENFAKSGMTFEAIHKTIEPLRKQHGRKVKSS